MSRWEWLWENMAEGLVHIAVLLFLLVFWGAVIYFLWQGILWLGGYMKASYEHDVTQCMQAFDYTRDQCEFIMKYHVKP